MNTRCLLGIAVIALIVSLFACGDRCSPDPYALSEGTWDIFRIYDPDNEDYIARDAWATKFIRSRLSDTRGYYMKWTITFHANGSWESHLHLRSLKDRLENLKYLEFDVNFRGAYEFEDQNYTLVVSDRTVDGIISYMDGNGFVSDSIGDEEIDLSALEQFMDTYSYGSWQADSPCSVLPILRRVGPFKIYRIST